MANGEEGEPGSVKDRYLLQHRPHLVLDGLRLMARESAREPRGRLRLRRRVRGVAASPRSTRPPPCGTSRSRSSASRTPTSPARRARWSGPSTAGPRCRPPSRRAPFEAGVGGAPTLVQNVETLAHVALLAARRVGRRHVPRHAHRRGHRPGARRGARSAYALGELVAVRRDRRPARRRWRAASSAGCSPTRGPCR